MAESKELPKPATALTLIIALLFVTVVIDRVSGSLVSDLNWRPSFKAWQIEYLVAEALHERPSRQVLILNSSDEIEPQPILKLRNVRRIKPAFKECGPSFYRNVGRANGNVLSWSLSEALFPINLLLYIRQEREQTQPVLKSPNDRWGPAVVSKRVHNLWTNVVLGGFESKYFRYQVWRFDTSRFFDQGPSRAPQAFRINGQENGTREQSNGENRNKRVVVAPKEVPKPKPRPNKADKLAAFVGFIWLCVLVGGAYLVCVWPKNEPERGQERDNRESENPR